MTWIRKIAAAVVAASAVAFAPAALAAEDCTCKDSNTTRMGEPSKATHDAARAKVSHDAARAKQAQAEKEEHDATLQRIWTAP